MRKPSSSVNGKEVMSKDLSAKRVLTTRTECLQTFCHWKPTVYAGCRTLAQKVENQNCRAIEKADDSNNDQKDLHSHGKLCMDAALR